MKPEKTRAQLRSERKRSVRSQTINIRRLSKAELQSTHEDYPEGVERPRTRGDCVNSARPCPFVSCVYHLYLDVTPENGSIKLQFPDIEVCEMSESCALDVSDRGGATLEAVGVIMNLTRERTRQVEDIAKAKIASKLLKIIGE